MFQTMKQLFAPTNKDLRQRILFTLGALMIFVIGTTIKVPGTRDITGNLGFLELLNVMGGGALKQFSIFALGVMPYITASIIMQLLQMDIIPYFSELSKQGPSGRQKINQITRYMGIIFAFIEGFAFSFAFLGSGSTAFDHMYVATIMTAGTAFLLWMGDQITQKGIGNGISLIIMAGIVVTLPITFIEVFKGLIFNNELALWVGILLFIAFVIVYIIIILAVIWIQEADRKIPIQYANKSTSVFGEGSYMPIKINSANVVPVIFASSLLAIPATIANFVKNEGFKSFVNTYLNYTTPVGFIIYAILIFLFGYFYTYIQMKPDEMAKNLQQNGGYIPGIRPGNDTEKYLGKVLSRLTVVGSTFLVIIAGIPILFSTLINLVPGVTVSSSVTIGGTGLLIVVGVALETYKQIEGSILSRSYKKGYSRR